jgi:hypothetical protein
METDSSSSQAERRRRAGQEHYAVPMPYTPPQEILDRYASVLVDFALGGGSGVQPGETVRVVAPESAKPLYAALARPSRAGPVTTLTEAGEVE